MLLHHWLSLNPGSGHWKLDSSLDRYKTLKDLEFSQQNKLKAHINQLWLERVPTSEIITVAGGLVSNMGTAHAWCVDNLLVAVAPVQVLSWR